MSKEKSIIGIDLGGTFIKFGLFDGEGNLKEKWQIRTRTESNGKWILSDIGVSVSERIRAAGLTMDDLAGIGIGVPGPVLKDGTVNRCINLGWGVVQVKEELQKITGFRNIFVANDSNVAALGEMWKGAAKGHSNVVMVTLGTGVGGGILINGKIVHGAFGAGGEIGHINISESETEPCSCGNRGCLEQYASAPGIVRMAKKELAESNRVSALRDKQFITAADVMDAAGNGDSIARGVKENVAKALGRALANVAAVVDPEIFVIGGGVANAGDILMEAVQRHYRQMVFHASQDTEFAFAQLGNDAGIYGAARLTLCKD